VNNFGEGKPSNEVHLYSMAGDCAPMPASYRLPALELNKRSFKNNERMEAFLQFPQFPYPTKHQLLSLNWLIVGEDQGSGVWKVGSVPNVALASSGVRVKIYEHLFDDSEPQGNFRLIISGVDYETGKWEILTATSFTYGYAPGHFLNLGITNAKYVTNGLDYSTLYLEGMFMPENSGNLHEVEINGMWFPVVSVSPDGATAKVNLGGHILQAGTYDLCLFTWNPVNNSPACYDSSSAPQVLTIR